MTLTLSQSKSLLIAYYQSFPNAIKQSMLNTSLHPLNELLAVCLSHYKGKAIGPNDEVSFSIKLNPDALFNFEVNNLFISDFIQLEQDLEKVGHQAAHKCRDYNFSEYLADVCAFTSSITHKNGLSYNALADHLISESEISDNILNDIPPYEDLGCNYLSNCWDNNDSQNRTHTPSIHFTQHKNHRLSHIDIAELIKFGDERVQELLNNLAWMIKAKHDLISGRQETAPIFIGEELFLAAAVGCIGLANEFAKVFGIPTFTLRFPKACIQLRKMLMEQVLERTTESTVDSVRGVSKHWFAIAEDAHKHKLMFEHETQAFMTKLLMREDDQRIGLSIVDISSLNTWIKQQNNKHHLTSSMNHLIKDFIDINMIKDETVPFLQAKQVKQHLHNKVIGQPLATENISAHLCALLLGKHHTKHLGVSTFLGTSGTGKTYLAGCIGDIFTNTLSLEYQVKILNMEQYSDARDAMKLFGSGAQYIDSALGDLTLSVTKNPRTIILFDEIEKAHPQVVQSLLTLIDKGYALDQTTKRKIDFSLCYFIFTSNIGSGEFSAANANLEFDPVEILTRRNKDKDRVLSPEMANRLAAGNITVFKPFKAKDLVKIAYREAINSHQRSKIKWPVSTLPEIILASLGGSATPRSIATQLNKIEGRIINELIDKLPDYQMNHLNKIRFSSTQLIEQEMVSFSIVSSQTFIPICNDSNVEVFSGSELTSIEAAFASKANAILIDESSMTVETSSVIQLMKMHPEKVIYTCSFESQSSKITSFSETIQSHYGMKESACAEIFNQVISEVQSQNRLIMATENSLRRNIGVTFDFGYQLMNDGIEVRFCSFSQKQRVSAKDAKLPFLSFAGKPTGSLNDVVGLESVKKRLSLIARSMEDKHSQLAEHFSLPKGYLLTGAPGTGKTHLARSLAAESDMFFFAVNSADLLLGNPVDNINQLFDIARRYAPSIIFLDEIDSIAKSRQLTGAQHAVVVNALLTAMDGFHKDDSKIFILAATNNADELDSALKRAGRFDRTIYFNLPCKEARSVCIQQWFDKQLIELTPCLKEELVTMLEGATIGRIREIFNHSVLCSVEENTPWHPQSLIEEIRAAKLGSVTLSLKQSEVQLANTAYHEAGHLVAHKLLLPDVPVDFASIQPRGAALGMVVPGQSEHEPLLSKHRIKAYLQVLLAGIAAEQMIGLKDDAQTIGGTDDRRKATLLAKRAIVDWGMSEQFGLAIPSELNTSNIQVNTEINDWLTSAFNDVRDLLSNNKLLLDKVSDALIEKEQLDKSDIDRLFSSLLSVYQITNAA
ncbi:AAA family ATPase [Shewanella sp. LC6]|uniref:AAA family ATPase n=1 Tax=unclassified Shewanella TaxID=196818 RepID=UPI00112DE2CC|nr:MULTISPECIES: AAA family ATPase [unclassified Shewanella]QQK58803.1 AAA family ATPase [Shewanella sp. LC6]TPE50631.1 AAA family ATPase [Shewanella sp. LC2]